MAHIVVVAGLAGAGLLCASAAHAAFTCNGPLTQAQVAGFDTLFSPPYSPALSKVGPLVKPEHFAKKVTKQQIATLEVAKPLIAATATLGENGAKFLKDALNDNAQSSVPGWFSTVIGAVIPVAWIGSTADVMVQLLNSSGDAGRISLANLAGTVGNGGNVAVVHRIGKDAAGGRKYIWTYSYTANINGKPTTTLLYTCAADVIETA